MRPGAEVLVMSVAALIAVVLVYVLVIAPRSEGGSGK